MSVSANTFPQLFYCFCSTAQNCIQQEGGKKEGKRPNPPQQTLQNVYSKMQILVAATKAEVQGPQTGLLSAKEVFHISQKSTAVGS